MKNKVYKNILLMCLRKIGDTVMATSAAYLLKRAYPQAKITMMVKPLALPIAEHNPVIDKVLVYNYSHKIKLNDMNKAVKSFAAENFDLAIILDYKPRSAMLTWLLARIPERIGFENVSLRNLYLRLFYTHIYQPDYDFLSTQQIKIYETVINALTGNHDRAKAVMPTPSDKASKNVYEFLSVFQPASLKIALCIRSGCDYKDYPLQQLLQVITAIADKYSQAVFYIIGTSADSPYAAEFISKSGLPIKNFCGKTDLPGLGCLLEHTDFLLTVDTGTAHIAAAVDTPQVVIFVGTPPLHWAPYSDKATAVYPQLSYKPWEHHNKALYEHLVYVEPAEIIAACEHALNQLLSTCKIKKSRL